MKKKCSRCGKEYDSNVNFCTVCGQDLRDSTESSGGNSGQQSPKSEAQAPVMPEMGTPKKPRKKLPYIIVGIVVLIMVIAGAVEVITGGGNQNKVVEKLLEFTSPRAEDMSLGGQKYIFDSMDENWRIEVTEENVAVVFVNDEISQCLDSTGIVNEGYFAYDLDQQNANIYVDDVDSDGGHISIYTYNTGSDQWTLLKEGQRYDLSEEFETYFRDNGLPEAINADIGAFRAALSAHDLTMEDVTNLDYKSVEKGVKDRLSQPMAGEQQEEPMPSSDGQAAAAINDVSEILGINQEAANALGLKEDIDLDMDGMTALTNEDFSLAVFYENESMMMVRMSEGCPYPFHGVYVGDTITEAETKLAEVYEVIDSDTQSGYLSLVDEDEGISVWVGNFTSGDIIEQITINLVADVAAQKDAYESLMGDVSQGNGETEATEAESEESVLTDPVTMGYGGAYVDDETGERAVIAYIGYETSYVLYSSSGEQLFSEADCGYEDASDSLVGEFHYFFKNENGLLSVSSGMGGETWGNYRRVSGTYNSDVRIEGTYGDDDTTIVVSDQMVDLSRDILPTGADFASVEITYNNGMVIYGRLYTQGDGSVAIIDRDTQSIYGMATFTDGKVRINGSSFDGTYKRI